MSQTMDYDPSQPKHTPIIISIVLTIVFVLLMTVALIYFFKGALKSQETKNESVQRNGFNLSQLNEWENSYLKSSSDDKITIDDAIYITIIRYNN